MIEAVSFFALRIRCVYCVSCVALVWFAVGLLCKLRWKKWSTNRHWMCSKSTTTSTTQANDHKKSKACNKSTTFLLIARYVPNVAKRSIWDRCNIEDRPTTDRTTTNFCFWKSLPGKTSNGHGHNEPLIGSRPPRVKWSRDRWRHVTLKGQGVTPLSLRRHILLTVLDRRGDNFQ